jgi:hypothetical protein
MDATEKIKILPLPRSETRLPSPYTIYIPIELSQLLWILIVSNFFKSIVFLPSYNFRIYNFTGQLVPCCGTPDALWRNTWYIAVACLIPCGNTPDNILLARLIILWQHARKDCGDTHGLLWQHAWYVDSTPDTLWRHTWYIMAEHLIPCGGRPNTSWRHTQYLEMAHLTHCDIKPDALWQHAWCIVAACLIYCGGTPNTLRWQT